MTLPQVFVRPVTRVLRLVSRMKIWISRYMHIPVKRDSARRARGASRKRAHLKLPKCGGEVAERSKAADC